MEHRVETGDRWCTPFDHYRFTASAFVVDATTNASIPITLAVGNSAPGESNDFITTYKSEQTTTIFTYDNGTRRVAAEVDSCTAFAQVKRSARSRALTLSMFAINWVLTLCSVAIAMSVVMMEKVKDGVSLLPVTIILSIPAIRSLYIGSPPFGIYLGTHHNYTTPLSGIHSAFQDMVGFFPQMLTVVICAIVSILSRPTPDRCQTCRKGEV